MITSAICTGGEKRKVSTVPTPPAWAFQELSGSASMRASHGNDGRSEVQSARMGFSSTMSRGGWVVVEVVVDSAVPSPLRKTLTARASSATVRMTPASTIRARAPAVVRNIGCGATGSGAWREAGPAGIAMAVEGGVVGAARRAGHPGGGPAPSTARPRRRRLFGARRHPAGLAGGSAFEIEGLEESRRGARRACRPRSSPGVVPPAPTGVPAPSRYCATDGDYGGAGAGSDPAGRGLVGGKRPRRPAPGQRRAGPAGLRSSCHTAPVASSRALPVRELWVHQPQVDGLLPRLRRPGGPGRGAGCTRARGRAASGASGRALCHRSRRGGAPAHRHRRNRPGARRGPGSRGHPAGGG